MCLLFILKDIFKHAEQYVKEYSQKEKDEIRLKLKQRSPKKIYIPDELKLAFVIRMKGINGVIPRVRKEFSCFD